MIKKVLYAIADNEFTGRLVRMFFGNRIPDLRWKGYRFAMPNGIVNRLYSSVFWGFYESAEIRMVEKYIGCDLNVIELGGSSGIVSAHIVSKLNSSQRYVVAEMNPDLIPVLKTNIDSHNHNHCSVTVINKAVSYSYDHVSLKLSGNSTETSILGNVDHDGGLKIITTKLSDLVILAGDGEYVLVSDIEGAEAELFNEENEAISKCRQLIIELHNTEYKGKPYSVDELKNLITSRHGFSLIQRDGFVFYFEKGKPLTTA